MPKSSVAVAVSMIVLPRAALAGALSVMAGAGVGDRQRGLDVRELARSGSDCGPARNGRKSTALEVVAVVVTTGAPLTGFSGTGGLNAGEIGGPGVRRAA